MNPVSFFIACTVLLCVRFCYVSGFALRTILLCVRIYYAHSKRFDVILHNFYTNLET